MPSLFSRVRTASTPSKPVLHEDNHGLAYDELGRITSRGSTNRQIASLTSGKKDKSQASKKDKTKGRKNAPVEEDEPVLPDGTFLPLSLEPPPPRRPPPVDPRLLATSDPAARARLLEAQKQEPDREQDYGYLSYQRHIVLGLDEVDRLVRVLADELGSRGLTTPFIFSSLALDVSAQGVRRLINAFLRTCAPFPAGDSEPKWREEVRFAGPQELGMALRWGLARVVRISGGNAVRGFVPWENYIHWSESEIALNYPPTHFASFLEPLQPILRNIIFNVLSLLARLTAHSASSGHTPPSLSPLFGPLLFGLGSPSLAFQHAYAHYLRTTNAMEHLLLAFVRWQDAPSNDSANSIGVGSAASLGVPARLKDWIRGYPAMLPERAKKQDRLTPRRGARTVNVVSVRRNVKMYTPDLVKDGSAWAVRFGAGSNTFGSSKEWERVAPSTLKLPPRYSDSYRKRMDLSASFNPSTAIAGSSVSSTSSGSSSFLDDDYFGLGKEDERFRSLTDLKWGEFEAMGFGGLGDKKLQFDLTESARTERAAKRTTLNWSDFSTMGFSRTDAPLNATLEFTVPVANAAQTSEQQEEMRRKLKKAQRGLPTFGWDTEPVMGPEEVIEEAFLDVFCDLIYGGGWMDLEREEEFDRECNWALVEYKSLPVARSTASGTNDPRTSTTVFLFEEFVPLEYRQQLSQGVKKRKLLPGLFSPSKSKQWKPAPTLNGRPYVIGATPSSPSVREIEFEGMLRGNRTTTKVIHFDRSGTVKGTQAPTQTQAQNAPRLSNATQESTATERPVPPLPPLQTTPPPPSTPVKTAAGAKISGPLYVGSHESDLPSPLRPSSPHRRARFRIPLPGSTPNRTSGLPPSEYEDLDFETRLASTDDIAFLSGGRRQSKDDAWVDILVAGSGRRLGGQDAELRPRPAGPRPRQDPEDASMEVAQVMSGVRPMSEVGEDDGDMSDDGDRYGVEESMTIPHRTDIPDISPHTTPDDEDDTPVPSRRRMGYFDLHPERKRATDDLPLPPRKSVDGESDEVPYPSTVQRAEAPVTEPNSAPFPSKDVPKLATSQGTPGRTAALIEMYRQRDAAAAASTPSKQVRGLPKTPKDKGPLPEPDESDLPSPMLREGDNRLSREYTAEDLEPPKLELTTPGRESPYRYVHGAPLHNVTEEEEED